MKDLSKMSSAQMLEMLTDISEILDRDYKNDKGHQPAALQVEAIGNLFFDEGMDPAIFYEFSDLSRLIRGCTTKELLSQIDTNIDQYGAAYERRELRQLRILTKYCQKRLHKEQFKL